MTSAQLFGPSGEVTYEAPVRAVPGTFVALYDAEMVQLSGWAQIGIDWVAHLAPVHAEGLVRYAVLWDGIDRMRRTPVAVPIRVTPENVPVDLSFEPGTAS
jgi:hypothetical protein